MALNVLQSGTGFASIQALKNAMYQAEKNLPEHTPVELQMHVNTVYVPILGQKSLAQYFATQVNNYVQTHTVKVDNETITPWPGNSVIAFGDDSTSTLTVKWVKGQEFILAIIDILSSIAPYAIGSYIAYTLIHLIEKWFFGSSGSPLSPKNIGLSAGILAALVLGPLAIREVGSIVGAERKLVRAVRGR